MSIIKRSGSALAAVASIAMLLCAAPTQATAADGWASLTSAEKQSSYGYFVWKSENAPTQDEKNGAAQAASILKTAPKKDYTSIGSVTDATSLTNFKEAVAEAQRINDFRSAQTDEPCRTDLAAGAGRVCDDANLRLTPLVLTDVLMAVAQSDANYSKDYNNGHAQQYNVGENLAWGQVVYQGNSFGDKWKNCKVGQSASACNWYWGEKPNYDANPNFDGNGAVQGHYRNLTNKAFYGIGYSPYERTGVAINSKADYGNIVGQVYSTASLDQYNRMSAPTYSTQDYAAAVDAYVNLVHVKTIVSVVNPAAVTVDSGTEKPVSALPSSVGVTYDDGTTGTAKVTWTIPDDWNKELGQHDVAVTGTVEGTDKTATITLTVRAATVKSVFYDTRAITVDSGTDPAPQLPATAKATWSNGMSTTEPITWETSDAYKNRDGGTYTLKGKIGSTGFPAEVTITVRPATVKSVANPTDATVTQGTKPTVPTSVKVTWSNGDVTDETIVWNAGQNPADASFDTLGTQTFTGTAGATGQTVTWRVTVVAAVVTKVHPVDPITVPSGTDPTPKLPATVTADLSNGTTSSVPVKWDPVPDTWQQRDGGTITLKGVVNGQQDQTATITITVTPATISRVTVSPDALTTQAGVDPTPQLPSTATVAWSNGDATANVPVTWKPISAADYVVEGKTFNATGTVTVDGRTATVTLPITVSEPVALSAEPTADGVSTIAGKAPDLSGIKAKVTYSDRSSKEVAVTWPAIDASKYAQAGTFTVTGTVDGVTINGKPATVTVTVTVGARAITSVTVNPVSTPITVPTAKDDAPKPTAALDALTVTATWNDGTTSSVPVTWSIPDGWNHPRAKHSVTVTGTVDGWKDPVSASIVVEAADAESVAAPTALTTVEGVVPKLPGTARVTWSNGETSDETVTWTKPDDSVYNKASDTPITVNGTVAGLPVSVQITVTAATIESVDDPINDPASVVTVDAGTKPTLPAQVTVHLSNGKTAQAAVTWNAFDGYKTRGGGDFTVKGTVAGWNGTVSVKVHVNPATVTGATVNGATEVTVASGTNPIPLLGQTATLTWSDGGDPSEAPIAWAAFDGYKNRDGGDFTVTGTVDGWSGTLTATVHVNPATALRLENDGRVSITVTVGDALQLPATLNVVWSNGDVTSAAATWEAYDPAHLAEPGTFAVNGKAGGFDAVATVTVNPSNAPEPKPTEPTEPGDGSGAGSDSDGSNSDGSGNASGSQNANGQNAGDANATGDAKSDANASSANATNGVLTSTGAAILWVVIAVVVLAGAAIAALTISKRRR